MAFVDPTRISEELGGEQAFRDLAAAGLGIILDIVPNHMGTGDENRWWVDETLRPKFFDIDSRTGDHRRFDRAGAPCSWIPTTAGPSTGCNARRRSRLSAAAQPRPLKP